MFKTHGATSRDQVIRRLVQMTRPTLLDIIENQPRLWRQLVSTYAREHSGGLTDDEAAALFARLSQALPADLAQDLGRYSDGRDHEAHTTQEAAFALGFALGQEAR